MRFCYTDRLGVTTNRRIEPHGVFVRAPFGYVLAFDIDIDVGRGNRSDAERMF